MHEAVYSVLLLIGVTIHPIDAVELALSMEEFLRHVIRIEQALGATMWTNHSHRKLVPE
jgi:hypothetical protein